MLRRYFLVLRFKLQFIGSSTSKSCTGDSQLEIHRHCLQIISAGKASDTGSGVTVAAAALIAGSTVSIFAAKSLPLVFGASAVYVAAGRNLHPRYDCQHLSQC